jgi:hypothetical protein
MFWLDDVSEITTFRTRKPHLAIQTGFSNIAPISGTVLAVIFSQLYYYPNKQTAHVKQQPEESVIGLYRPDSLLRGRQFF